ncbi:hypothetical protein LXA43DRAFT_903418 [Ganoderma leucocontextum]|nr:hypothetical protein LXA43DRAFT_903418 [Ganoderma leucocontextum]
MCHTHRNTPYHWVEEWIQPDPDVPKWCFKKRDLSELGLVLYLGHQGRRCDQVSSGPPEIHTLVITHVNGIHTVFLEYCECSSPRRVSHEEQLVLAGLIPASFQKLQSAFTVEVLEDAHEDILASRKSTYDYMRKLRRRTNNSAAHLMMIRSGSCHGVRYPGRDPNQLTVPCFTCPWPGVNLPEDFKTTDPEMGYIYRLFLGADGNYSLQKKTKPGDDTDYSLIGDNGFFNNVNKLQDFLKKYPKEHWNIVETCSGFKVTRSQRVGKFKNLDVSGVISITCTRHGCFRARGTCDMPGGEAFPLLDLAMSGALETAEDLLEWLLTYDVGCQYIANLLDRWKEWGLPEKYLPIVEKLRILLPQMHMLAHKESCQTDYCMGFKKGTGHTCGEMVETIWAEHNAIGLSTREMNGGARRDALNDFFNSWNWYKNEGRAKYLLRKLTEKLHLQLLQTRDLAALTEEAGPLELRDWLRLDLDDEALTPITYHTRPKVRQPSVYELDAAKCKSDAGAKHYAS